MFNRSFLHRLFALMVIASMLLTVSGQVVARPLTMPMSPTDESKVPHYFGPNPNWANSPFTLQDAQVVSTGDGSGATAEATVGANGVITGLTLTSGGHNYSNAKVDIFGSGTGATADVTIVKKGAVVAVNVDPLNPGSGYTAPAVTFSTAGAGGGHNASRRNPVDDFRGPFTGTVIIHAVVLQGFLPSGWDYLALDLVIRSKTEKFPIRL